MVKKYIVELESGAHIFVLGPEGIVHIGEPDVVYETVDGMQIGDAVINAKPYTEPDLEQVKKEAYEDGYNTGFKRKIDVSFDALYQEGLSDAWEAAKKIEFSVGNGGLPTDTIAEIFGTPIPNRVLRDFTASEVIEKLKQYEQEEDRQARIEFNCEEIKDVLNTTVKECNVSLDEIATILEKMREGKNG